MTPFGGRPARIDCPAECRADTARRAHHDRLLAVESDPDAVLDLFETAVTWAELEYDESATVPPARWVEFAQMHRWQNPERALRLFSTAADAALRGRRPTSDPLVRASGDGICPTLVPAPTRHLRLAP
ncbi:hypothetical protein GCM10009836_65670 [Pseudonocardia ailaonensis]|uniref:Bacterial transcriptional activator domain-containing protein n=1 Tax=Pseudonocardia ailaonensis TaxID=367279 RepID=A0ABN2NR96_9PSEU